MASSTKGQHLIIEFTNCNKQKIHNLEILDDFFSQEILKYDLIILQKSSHKFQPHGVTMLYLLSESHLSIHTWPEYRYLAFDLYSCGKSDIEPLANDICNFLECDIHKKLLLNRGLT